MTLNPKVSNRERAAVARGAPDQADWRSQLEDCRARLQSVELLLGSSPRDALALSRALLDDVMALLTALYLPPAQQAEASADAVMRALPSSTREHLLDARNWVEDVEHITAQSANGIAALRGVVTDVAVALNRTDLTGAGAFRAAFRRTSWLKVGVVAAVVLVVLGAVLQIRATHGRRAAEFDARFIEASARLSAGDHAGAVERFRKAIEAMPDTERTAVAWNDMGWSLQQLKRYEEAVAAYRKALLLQPLFPRARNNLDAAQRLLDIKKSESQRQQPAAGK